VKNKSGGDGMKGGMILLLCYVIGSAFFVDGASAASGKCTVVKVDGARMVIECNQHTRGFSKGSKIKIKSVNKGAVLKK
jgi:hypothetical protein